MILILIIRTASRRASAGAIPVYQAGCTKRGRRRKRGGQCECKDIHAADFPVHDLAWLGLAWLDYHTPVPPLSFSLFVFFYHAGGVAKGE